MTDIPDLTDRQREFLSQLHGNGASTPTIADALGVKPTTVEGIRNRVRERLEESDADVSLEYDRDTNKWYLVGQDKADVRRLSTKAKQTITKEANEFRTDMEEAIIRRLERREPLRAIPDPTPESEDLVIAFGDIHVGDSVQVYDREGEKTEVYNPKIAYGSVLEITQRALKIKRMMESMVDFDDVHVFWTGDMVTGMDVYNGQAFKIKMGLADQLAYGVEMLTHQIATLAEHFNTVTVTAVPGNHGLDRGSYSSGQANQDLNCYRWVADRLVERGLDNVDYRISEGEHSIGRELRGHFYHLRHGQNEQVHVDATARSQADQRGLLYATDFDVQIRGHYHKEREESVLNVADVVTCPSPKPGGEFAEIIGQPDCSDYRRLGKVWRVSDKRPKAGVHTIDDIDMDLDALDIPDLEDVRARYRSSAKRRPMKPHTREPSELNQCPACGTLFQTHNERPCDCQLSDT